eukprot:5596450-Prymnesium_polylepis.1
MNRQNVALHCAARFLDPPGTLFRTHRNEVGVDDRPAQGELALFHAKLQKGAFEQIGGGSMWIRLQADADSRHLHQLRFFSACRPVSRRRRICKHRSQRRHNDAARDYRSRRRV